MVTDKVAYSELIDYLTTNKSLFHNDEDTSNNGMPTVETLMEEEISEQVIFLCQQHGELEENHRAIIIREIDGIVYDIEQVLSEYWQQNTTEEQAQFINEFAGLIKNIFDGAIAELFD